MGQIPDFCCKVGAAGVKTPSGFDAENPTMQTINQPCMEKP
jgi:hypothetical protein